MMLVVTVLLMISIVAGVGFKEVILAYPGQTVDEFIRMQNLALGDPDLEFTGTLIDGAGVVSFIGSSEYEVPNGEIVDAPIRISVPSDAQIGQVYTISMVFRSVPVSADVDEGNAVQFTQSVGFSFDVKVVEQSQIPEATPDELPATTGDNTLLYILVVLGVVILIVIIWFALRKNKDQTNKS